MHEGDREAPAAERVRGVDRRGRAAEDEDPRRLPPCARTASTSPRVRSRWTLAAAGTRGSGVVSAPIACTSAVYSSFSPPMWSTRAPASMRSGPPRGRTSIPYRVASASGRLRASAATDTASPEIA